MQQRGYQVRTVVMDDLSDIHQRFGVPKAVSDCHTAILEGYFIEGHVPMAAIEKLLKERPDIAGLALPGMPAGSPGMSGTKTGPFVVLQVDKQGRYSEFGRY